MPRLAFFTVVGLLITGRAKALNYSLKAGDSNPPSSVLRIDHRLTVLREESILSTGSICKLPIVYYKFKRLLLLPFGKASLVHSLL